MQFYGYKQIAGKVEMYTINNQHLDELWTRANTQQRRRLIEKMKAQGRFDFIAYDEAQDLQGTVIDWTLGKLPTDNFNVTIINK